MNQILNKQTLAPGVNLFEIEAPHIAQKRKPGQFVIIRINEQGERIPLTIADTNKDKGTITIVAQVVGKTTEHLGTLKPGDTLLDVVGPLGQPTHIDKFGTVVAIGGGVGHAVCYPIARAMKQAGNYLQDHTILPHNLNLRTVPTHRRFLQKLLFRDKSNHRHLFR